MAQKAGGAKQAGGKGKKGGAVGGSGKKEEEREETLQAVILADSFETRFNPFTLEVPRCLLPLANTPLIEYTLEFLAMSGVTTIYIYCGAHTSAIESYLSSSKWSPNYSPAAPFASLEIIKTTARSVGDALRDLDARDLITGDFLLVHGDLVSNLPIDKALERHRKRRTTDKNAIMTMILREGGVGEHRTKAHGIKPVFVIDPTKDRCLHYEEMHPLQANRYVNIDPDLIKEHTEMEIRTDLIDCGIDICTPDVLALWAESFDYEVPRRNFLHGVLKDYELNGKTIHTEIVDDHYAARVSNLQSYEAVSRDVLGRWTYPLVPDSNLLDGQTYRFSRGGLCKENGVVLARTCKTGKCTILGRDTSIGDGSILSNCIIGQSCQIGKNVTIQNAFLWDNVVVGDNTTITRAIIANEASIGRNCTVSPGALISYQVVIADNTTVPPGKRITRAKRRRSDVQGEPLARVPADPAVVGPTGSGYELPESDDEFEDESAAALSSSLVYSTAHLNLSTDSISTFTSEVEDDDDELEQRERTTSFTSISEDEGTNESFHHDAVQGLLEALSDTKGDMDAAKLEFMGLRLSNNASDHQIRRAIATAFSKRIAQLVESGVEAAKAAAQTFNIKGATKFLVESAIGLDGGEDEQVDFMACLQKDLSTRKGGAGILPVICLELYNREVVEEEAFNRWWEEGNSEDKVREKTGVFIKALEDAEEESSDEEESD
ncbi:nucleotide-diphospho-sugar transferase [Bisporella sp. PMI_857]|nr:nucleotide-diphospho-sugar transferase [Bisporella sp. PMI_857]